MAQGAAVQKSPGSTTIALPRASIKASAAQPQVGLLPGVRSFHPCNPASPLRLEGPVLQAADFKVVRGQQPARARRQCRQRTTLSMGPDRAFSAALCPQGASVPHRASLPRACGHTHLLLCSMAALVTPGLLTAQPCFRYLHSKPAHLSFDDTCVFSAVTSFCARSSLRSRSRSSFWSLQGGGRLPGRRSGRVLSNAVLLLLLHSARSPLALWRCEPRTSQQGCIELVTAANL